MKVKAVKLENLMVRRGGSVDPKKFPDEEFDLYSIPAYDRGQKDIVLGREIGSSKQILATGDVLLSKIVPHIRRAWVVGEFENRRMIGSGEWIVFRSADCDPKFLTRVLTNDSFHARFMSTVSGVGGSLLRARPAEVAKIEIPLPPLAEQKRIAGILDAADALRAKRRAALAQLDALAQSLFLDLFDDPVTNPRGWPIRAFDDVCSSRLGKMLDAKKQVGENNRPYMRNINVQWGKLNLSAVWEMDFDKKDREEFRLLRNDVLICEGGAGVAQTAIWRGEIEECYFQKSLHRVRPKPCTATSEYIAHLIRMLMREGSALFRLVSSATIPHLTGVKLKTLKIPVPPLPLQQQFAAAVESIDRQKARHREHLAGLDALFASLQHRAFRGEL